MGLTPSSTLIEFDTIKADAGHREDVLTPFRRNPCLSFTVAASTAIGHAGDVFLPAGTYAEPDKGIIGSKLVLFALFEVGIVQPCRRRTKPLSSHRTEADLPWLQKQRQLGFYHQRQTKAENGEVFEYTSP